MRQDYTHLAVILDRTGSMESIRDDTIGGFNAFLEEQQQQPGYATLTLVQFDTQDPYEVIHRLRPINEIPKLTRATYVPRHPRRYWMRWAAASTTWSSPS